MEIHFCDLCNESVPQSDIDEGRAFVRRGRVVCATCERAMTHAADAGPYAGSRPDGETGTATAVAAAPAKATMAVDPTGSSHGEASADAPAALLPAPNGGSAPARGSSGLALAMVALLFAAGAAAVFNEQLRDLGRRESALASQVHTQDRALQNAERASQTARRDLAEARLELGRRVAEEREGREAALASLGTRTERLDELQRRLAQEIEAITNGTVTRTMEVDRRADDLSHRLARSEDENRALQERIAGLEEKLEHATLVLPGAPGALAGGPATPGAAGAGTPSGGESWAALVPDLSSPKAATRWEAVDQIGQRRDPESVPLLVPMLADTDVFVRMATARVLGDIQSTAAVPALIDALEDGEAAVREASLGALRVITGKDLRFDPLASEADRAKKVKAWRDWWKKLEEEGGPPAKGQG